MRGDQMEMMKAATGSGDGDVLVTFDTSVFLPYVLHELGLKPGSTFSMQSVQDQIEAGEAVILKDMAGEMEVFLMRDPRFGGRLDDAMDILNRFETVNPKVYKKELNWIKNIQEKLAQHPKHEMSAAWANFKRISLTKEGMNEPGGGAAKIRHLSRRAKRDNRLLAGAIKLCKERNLAKMCFITNDGDHMLLKDSVWGYTDKCLEIWRPPKDGK